MVLRGLNWKVVMAFLDDILVLGRDFEGHLANLSAVLVNMLNWHPVWNTIHSWLKCQDIRPLRAMGTHPWWLEHLRPGSPHTTAQTHIVSDKDRSRGPHLSNLFEKSKGELNGQEQI
jgi:hypothetical protein